MAQLTTKKGSIAIINLIVIMLLNLLSGCYSDNENTFGMQAWEEYRDSVNGYRSAVPENWRVLPAFFTSD